MDSSKYTYKLNWIFFSIVLWELLFWGLYLLIINTFSGYDSEENVDRLMYKLPQAFYLLLALIPIIGIYIVNLIRHNRIVIKTGDRVVQSIFRPVSTMSSFMKYFLFRNALALLIIALAQPVFGKKKVSGTSESLELAVCLDVSNSMNTRDISADLSRLEISKRALVQLLNNLHGEKIGLCLFANNAFVQLPLTQDYAAAKLFIQDIETGMITSQGTNIAAALEVASEMFSKEKTTKGIILVTDGENHEQNPDEILTKIKEKKIQLGVLGIGTMKGGLIPKHPDRPELGYKTNAVGKTIVSKLNKSFLQQIAQKGGGKASISSSEFPNLNTLLVQIKKMKRTKISSMEFDVKQERFQIPLLLSLIFWLAYLLWSRQYIGILDRFIKTK